MNLFYKNLWLLFLFLMVSCGSSDKLEIKGEPEAVQMAEEMLKALGGKKAWTKLRSVYIRTVVRASGASNPYLSEEWINLDQPKFMNKKTVNNIQSIDIVDGNDGWRIKGSTVEMIAPGQITSYLRWHEQHFLRVVKDLVEEKENIEVRKIAANQFEVFSNGKFLSGFELNESHLPITYYNKSNAGRLNKIFFKEYSEYKGYKFPLVIEAESMMAMYRTDYFDPSPLDAERAFKISFNPNELIK